MPWPAPGAAGAAERAQLNGRLRMCCSTAIRPLLREWLTAGEDPGRWVANPVVEAQARQWVLEPLFRSVLAAPTAGLRISARRLHAALQWSVVPSSSKARPRAGTRCSSWRSVPRWRQVPRPHCSSRRTLSQLAVTDAQPWACLGRTASTQPSDARPEGRREESAPSGSSAFARPAQRHEAHPEVAAAVTTQWRLARTDAPPGRAGG